MKKFIYKIALLFFILNTIALGIVLQVGYSMESHVVSISSRYDDGFWQLRTFDVDRQLMSHAFPELHLRQLPYLSPNRRYVAWTVDLTQIEMQDLDTDENCHLIFGAFISWSPDSLYFAFQHVDRLYIYDITQGCSGGSILISPELSVDVYNQHTVVSWSPDGQSLVFSALDDRNDDQDYDVYVYRIGGEGIINLTADLPNDNMNPSWSADGQQIAFIRIYEGDTYLHVIDQDGTNPNPQQITQTPIYNIDSPLHWSSDGAMLAFTINSGLHVFVVESGLLIGPIDQGWQAQEIVWASNNERILFRSGRTSDLFMVNRDGRFLRRLTHDDNTNILMP